MFADVVSRVMLSGHNFKLIEVLFIFQIDNVIGCIWVGKEIFYTECESFQVNDIQLTSRWFVNF